MNKSHRRLWALLAASVAIAGIIILAPSAPARSPVSLRAEYAQRYPALAEHFTNDLQWNKRVVWTRCVLVNRGMSRTELDSFCGAE